MLVWKNNRTVWSYFSLTPKKHLYPDGSRTCWQGMLRGWSYKHPTITEDGITTTVVQRPIYSQGRLVGPVFHFPLDPSLNIAVKENACFCPITRSSWIDLWSICCTRLQYVWAVLEICTLTVIFRILERDAAPFLKLRCCSNVSAEGDYWIEIDQFLSYILLEHDKGYPLPSNRHHRSSGDCLEGRRENCQVCSVQYCVQQSCAHTYEQT